MQTIDNLLTSSFLGYRVIRELEGDHDERNVLRSVCLGGGDTDFRTSVDVDTAVSFSRQRRTNGVDDTETQGASLQTVSHGENGVGSFTRLGNEDGNIISEDGCPSIQKVRGQLDSDRDLCQFFKDGSDLFRFGRAVSDKLLAV